ncbi:MAG: hypothetical protein K6T78_04590 [Alicyclobacillus sp.]|nr:hypothetical protein [Alicyclobacillus sp.]
MPVGGNSGWVHSANPVPAVVGVVGAGTMGAGIAQVAVTSGARVVLFDVEPRVLERAVAGLTDRLQRSVEKGQRTAEDAASCLERLSTTTELSDLAAAELVVEAVPEKLELKRRVFAQLEAICPPSAVLASNTSSLPISVLGAGLTHAERVVGMHFFNPAPVMRLVEVVAGEDTDPAVVERVREIVAAFGKQAIVCQDTPGFIVNRVARNFYGEALRIVGEGTADVSQVDELLQGAAGFRMGPFELMDLIGIDVNYDVTQSVYAAFHQEPRFRPHPLQARKVAAGQLGRKTGRGFYRYDGGVRVSNASPDRPVAGPSSAGQGAGTRATATASVDTPGVSVQAAQRWTAYPPVVVGDTPLANALRARIATVWNRPPADCGLAFAQPQPHWDETGKQWRAEEVEAFLRAHPSRVVMVSVAGDETAHRQILQAVERAVARDAVLLTSVAGPSTSRQAAWLTEPKRLRGFSIVLRADGTLPGTSLGEPLAEWFRPVQAIRAGGATEATLDAVDEACVSALAALGFAPRLLRDGPGGVALRILSMVLNEAQVVLHEGTATAADIDLGMRLGTNYPAGPVEWLNGIGPVSVWYALSALQRELGDARYQPSPGLTAAAWYRPTKTGGEEC